MTSIELLKTTSVLTCACALALTPLAIAPHLTTVTVPTCEEDQPCWSCVDDGNRICGPGNPEGKPAACYDQGGVIVALWPCFVVVDPHTGESDVYTSDDRATGPNAYDMGAYVGGWN